MSDPMSNPNQFRKGGEKDRKRGKIRRAKRRNITSLVLAYRSPPKVNAYDFFLPSFDDLFKKIGEGPLSIVFGYIAFDVKNTRLCDGLQCPERFYRDSPNHYCRSCYLQMKEEGFDWCKHCRRPSSDCDHCPVCGRITCVCGDIDRYEWCGCSYTLCIC